MAVTTHRFDDLTIEHMQGAVGAKWTMFPDCIGAWVAEMDFGTAPAVQEALHSTAHAGHFGYMPIPVMDQLQQACADWYERSTGWRPNPEWIHLLPDVVKGMELSILHFSRLNSKVIVPTPAYFPFLTVPRFLGREVIEVPCIVENGRWRLDYDGIEAALVDGSGLLILCNPNNPLGRVLEAEEMLRVADIVEKHGGRVFADEIHAPLVYSGNRHVPYASLSETTASHSVTAVSASKAWNLAGLKCAQIIMTNEADQTTYNALDYFSTRGASTLGAIANSAAFNDGEAWLKDVLVYLDGNRWLLKDLLTEHLPQSKYVAPEGTYLTWIDMRAYDIGQPLDEYFRERAQVALVDGVHCGEAGKGFARFNIAMSRPVLAEAIERMGQAVNG